MGGQHGVDEILKVANSAGNIGEDAEKILLALKSGSVFGKLKVITIAIGMVGDAQAIAGTDLNKLKAQAAELDDADKTNLVANFSVNFDLDNNDVEAAVEEIIDGILTAAALAGPLIDLLKEQYPKLAAVVLKIAALFKKP